MTLSPSRTERGSMDKVTTGGSEKVDITKASWHSFSGNHLMSAGMQTLRLHEGGGARVT